VVNKKVEEPSGSIPGRPGELVGERPEDEVVKRASGTPRATPPRMIVPAPAFAASVMTCSCSRSIAEYGTWNTSKTPISMCSTRCGRVPDIPMKRTLPLVPQREQLGDGVVFVELRR
jgi:hypothetical protein